MQIVTQKERFEDHLLEVVAFGGERWLKGPHIAEALGFANPADAAKKMYQRNQSEFGPECCLALEVPTGGGRQLTRIYNARGAALFAMKANTPKGKAFRRWVFDVLEGRAETETGPVRAATDMSGSVSSRLRTLFLETPKMRQLVRYRGQGLGPSEIAKLLDVSRAYVSTNLRVAEYLGLVEADEKLETYRATPQYQKFLQGKADYYQRKKARKAAEQAALAAPASNEEGQSDD